MEYGIIAVIALYCTVAVIYFVVAHGFQLFKKPAVLWKRTYPKEKDGSPPLVIKPMFQIIYAKETIDDEDIEVLAEYAIYFDQISPKNPSPSLPSNEVDKIYVRFDKINFNNLKKISV
ncbi:MAG: hypothetical protein LBG80_04600 [Bacteroidales bacterium]|jgi:hypothetical protein|nr:hypothetical protein [Bacteroidales bacterium]